MRFNRTFMELKLGYIRGSGAGSLSFNRTFMELKHNNKYWQLGDKMF